MVCSAHEKRAQLLKEETPLGLGIFPGCISGSLLLVGGMSASCIFGFQKHPWKCVFFLAIETDITLILSVAWKSESGWETMLGGQVSVALPQKKLDQLT